MMALGLISPCSGSLIRQLSDDERTTGLLSETAPWPVTNFLHELRGGVFLVAFATDATCSDPFISLFYWKA